MEWNEKLVLNFNNYSIIISDHQSLLRPQFDFGCCSYHIVGQRLTIQDIPSFSLTQNIVLVCTSTLSLLHRILWKAIVSEDYSCVGLQSFHNFYKLFLIKVYKEGVSSLLMHSANFRSKIDQYDWRFVIEAFFGFVCFLCNNISW